MPIALGLPIPPPPADGIRRLGVSLRPHREKATTVAVVAGTVRQLLESRTVEEVALISFCGDPAHGDTPVLSEIRRLLRNHPAVRIIPYSPNPFATLTAVAQCTAFIGMRLHSQIFAYMAGVPFLALSYHRKCDDFLHSIGASTRHGLTVAGLTADGLASQMTDVSETGLSVALPYDEAARQTLQQLEDLGNRMGYGPFRP